ncbi:MAG: lysylphosphatidylglycerol synthase transmembrane domain-containing protein [Anaerolineae bacterium]
MRKYRNQIITGLALTLGIYIVLLVVLDNTGNFNANVGEQLQAFPVWLYAPLILSQIGAGFFRFLEWHYYLGVIDARDKISLKDSLIIFVSAFTMVVSPGKLAEVLKSVFLKMKTGVPIAKSAPVVFAERIVDGLAVIVILVATLVFAGDYLELGTYRGISEAIVYSSAALLAFGLIVVQIKPLAYFFLNLIPQLPFLKRLHEPLVAFYESSYEIFKLKHVIPTTIMGLGVYFSSTFGFVLILWGFGVELSWTMFLQATFIVGVGSAIGALSFVPNGAGVTEVSNVAMLNAIVVPVYPEIAPYVAAAALLQGFFHKWFRVIVGAGVAVIYRKRLFTSELEAEIAEMEANRTPAGEQAVQKA